MSNNISDEDIVITSAFRTPIGSFLGSGPQGMMITEEIIFHLAAVAVTQELDADPGVRGGSSDTRHAS